VPKLTFGLFFCPGILNYPTKSQLLPNLSLNKAFACKIVSCPEDQAKDLQQKKEVEFQESKLLRESFLRQEKSFELP